MQNLTHILTFVFALIAHAPEAPALVEVVAPLPPGEGDVGVANAKLFPRRDRAQRYNVDRHVTVVLQNRITGV